MPTDVVLSMAKRRQALDREGANLIAILLLIPMIACLCSILMSVVSPEFSAVVTMAAE